jgi:hypothetical protein
VTLPAAQRVWRVRVETGLRRLASVGWPLAVLIGVYLVIDLVVRGVTDLGEAGYQQPSLILELLPQSGFAVTLILLVWSVVVWRTRSFDLRWPGFERGWSFRLPVGVAIVLLTWWFSTYTYNLYFDQGHWIDRAVLIALSGLALWRPIFTVPWVLLVASIMQQFFYPIGGYSVAEQFLLVRVVELFIATMLIRLAIGRWHNADFLLALICLIAGSYWVPGVGKLQLGWLQAGPHAEANLFTAYANGWLGNLSFDSISAVGRGLRSFGWPMLIGTTAIELGAVAILWGRRALVAWLGMFIAFHLAVLALTGIFFWRWIALEVALLVFLLRDRLLASLPIFTWAHAVLATGLIVVAPLWGMPVKLAWLDAPVSYTYRFVATDATGETGRLPATFFAPYDYQFSLSTFEYLSDDTSLLPNFWGNPGGRSILEAVYDAESAAGLFALEATFGTDLSDANRAESLDQYLMEFVSNWNRRGATGFALAAPPQLWTFPSPRYSGDGPIQSIAVWRVMTWWDGSDYQEIRTTRIREIDIASEPPSALDRPRR